MVLLLRESASKLISFEVGNVSNNLILVDARKLGCLFIAIINAS